MQAWMTAIIALTAGLTVSFPNLNVPQAGIRELFFPHHYRPPVVEIGNSVRPWDEQPIFRFGLIADVQYADKDARNGRYYREAAGKLRECVTDLSRNDLRFIVDLGDIIDGNGTASGAELSSILKIFDQLKAPVRHVIGNHCLTVGRPELHRALRLKSSYYMFEQGRWRFLVLDGMDISTKAPSGSEELEQARQYIQRDPSLPEYNGAVGERQLGWLADQLASAHRKQQQVVVFCHHPVLPAAGNHSVVLWNYREVLRVLENAGCVFAFISGHYHPGGYAEQNGIHHVIIPGLVETPAGSSSYAVVSVFTDRLQIRGYGSVPSRELRKRPAIQVFSGLPLPVIHPGRPV